MGWNGLDPSIGHLIYSPEVLSSWISSWKVWIRGNSFVGCTCSLVLDVCYGWTWLRRKVICCAFRATGASWDVLIRGGALFWWRRRCGAVARICFLDLTSSPINYRRVCYTRTLKKRELRRETFWFSNLEDQGNLLRTRVFMLHCFSLFEISYFLFSIILILDQQIFAEK